MKTFNEWLKNRTMLEYEQYVDEDGYAHDDEGNSSFVGKQYSGGTYGLHDLPRGYDVPTHRQRKQVDASLVASIKTALQKKPNEFLRSILRQIESGSGLTDRQITSAKRAIEGRKPFLPVQTNPFEYINPNQIDALEKASSKIDSGFLRSVLDQVKVGKRLSEKQKRIVRGILQRLGMKSDAQLFESWLDDLERPIKPGDKWTPPPTAPFNLNGFFKNIGRNSNGAFPEIICNDGFSMSVQAGKNYYSDPKSDNAAYGEGYKSVEVSSSDRESLLSPFRKDGDVYLFVPVGVVEEIVMKHNGLDHTAVQHGDRDWRNKVARS